MTSKNESTIAGSYSPSGFIPELDGLRALAIFGVIITHSFFNLRTESFHVFARFGWIGVDLFFVISGFLITGLLLQGRDDPHYFRNFYIRRALRIWPIYYLLLLFTFYIGPWIDPIFDFSKDHFHFWVFALYLQNLQYLAFTPLPLFITWSLCIEEQFYAVWPFIVKTCDRQRLAGVAGLLLFFSCGLRLYLLFTHVSAISLYVFTFTRLDSLMCGVLLAVATRIPGFEWTRYKAWWLGLAIAGLSIGLGILAWGAARMPQSEYEADALAVFPMAIGFAGLVGSAMASRSGRGPLSRFLCVRPMRYIGKISYGIYIVHPATIVLFSLSPLGRWILAIPSSGLSDLVRCVLEITSILAVASLSWYCVERPLLRLKRFFPRQSQVDT